MNFFQNNTRTIKTFLLLSLLSITFPVNTNAASDDFCKKFPLNRNCLDESQENSTNSYPNRSDINNSDIIDNLTIDDVEKYLQELGYINFTRNKKNTFLYFLMQGMPCTAYISTNGAGIALFTFFYQDKETSLEAINKWNRELRFSFAYLLEDTEKYKNTVVLETNLTVVGGVTKDRIMSFLLLHSKYQSNFSRYLSEL